MSYKYSHNKKSSTEKGFVLLLTMIIVSVILSISLSIVTITIKEIKLGGYMRESERAFIAADRALECALFWDRALPPQPGALQFTPFATASDPIYVYPPGVNNAECHDGVGFVRLNNAGVTGWVADMRTDGTVPPATGRTFFRLTYSNGTSADVTVWKSGINTTITANGYNVTNPTANPRATQRTIVANYNL